MCPLDDGDWELTPAGWRWHAAIDLEVIDPLSTLTDSDLGDIMRRLVLSDQECIMSPMFPDEDDGRFDDAEELYELAGVSCFEYVLHSDVTVIWDNMFWKIYHPDGCDGI
ncbi:hypothetical protein RIF29_34680 [Crotalaria pallida]|uniref:Uncharacterized protein n=1 Tax=Crotalaria pallida TaxID=3830 RepID=A0AAN9EBT5_CROPI